MITKGHMVLAQHAFDSTRLFNLANANFPRARLPRLIPSLSALPQLNYQYVPVRSVCRSDSVLLPSSLVMCLMCNEFRSFKSNFKFNSHRTCLVSLLLRPSHSGWVECVVNGGERVSCAIRDFSNLQIRK